MHPNFSSNDDDLFSPIPESTKKESSFVNREDVIDSLMKNVYEGDMEATLVRAHLAHLIYDTANNFIFDINSANRTVFNTLNTLTNNMFSYNVYIDVLEETISKRIVIYDFISTVGDADNQEVIRLFAKHVNAKIDDFFIDTYVNSTIEMLDFVIDYNIDIYKKVCLIASREPIPNIIERQIHNLDSSLMDSSGYMLNNITSNIRKSLGFEY